VSKLTLGEASKLTGISKPTISKAVKDGKVSGKKNNKGVFEIEKSELIRVYPEVKAGADKPIKFTKEMATNAAEIENKFLKEKIEELEKQIQKTEAREDAANKRLDTVLVQLEDQRPKTFWQRLSGK
tara:strand:+ start:348 stop:728 length:381 start_codon:yes stop_codon:yes gene_type:complete